MESSSINEIENNFDVYCKCKITKEKIEFLGFNNEIIKIDSNFLPKETLENDAFYILRHIKKEIDTFIFIKDKSSFSKTDGINLKDNIENMNRDKPYSFTGKIVQKENNIIIFLTLLNAVITLTNINDSFKDLSNLNENTYVTIFCAKFVSKVEGEIILELVKNFSSFKIVDNPNCEEINKKVALKFKVLDLDDNNNNNIIGQFGVELPDKSIKKLIPNKDMIYFVYDTNESEPVYFPQTIYIYDNNNKYMDINMKYFVYKSSLTEANIYIKQKCFYSYEFLHFSLDNSFPKYIEVYSQYGNKNKYDNFRSFGSNNRKTLVLLNISPQDEREEKENENSFLKIYLCNQNSTKVYGSFCLNSIKKKIKKYYHYNHLIKDKIINIYDDFIKCFITQKEKPKYLDKYLNFEDDIIKSINRELFQKNFDLYIYENNEFIIKYFNSLCFFNLFYFLRKKNFSLSYLNDYKNVYEKVTKKNNLNYIQKSMILVSYLLRIFEDKNSLRSPKIFFYDEINNDKNPYKTAYNFQYEIINNLSENSCLFQPFLLLDSHIMKCLTNLININSPAYSLSMISINIIKDHLKSSINNCFFVLEKEGKKNNRNYYASIHKFNGIITYNENILLENSNYNKMYEIDEIDIISDPKIINDYAYALFFENLHENFSLNKELILNFQESPRLFINRNLNFAEVSDYNFKEYGEAGRLVESFIGNKKLVEAFQNIKYKMGDFLKVKYFVDKDFSLLISEFYKYVQSFNLSENDLKEMFGDKSQIKNNEEDEAKIETNNSLNKENTEQNKIIKIDDLKSLFQDENENEIYLAQDYTYIVTGETYEKLLENLEKAKKKKFILPKRPIEKNNDVCMY